MTTGEKNYVLDIRDVMFLNFTKSIRSYMNSLNSTKNIRAGMNSIHYAEMQSCQKFTKIKNLSLFPMMQLVNHY